MTRICYALSVLLLVFTSTSVSSCLTRVSCTREAVFRRLVTRVFAADVSSRQVCSSPLIARAGTTLFALALANGLIQEPYQVKDFYEAVESMDTRYDYDDEGDLVNHFLGCFQSIKEELNHKYRDALLRSPNNAIRAMSNAMEEMQRIRKLRSEGKPTIPPLIPQIVQVTGRKLKTLGCEFDDHEYTYRINEFNPFSKKPRFAKVTPPPMQFEDASSLLKPGGFFDVLKESCLSVMESTTYNDVDQLIRFISEYPRNQDLVSFNKKTYKYIFRPSEDSAVFEMQIRKELELRYPQALDHMYLISVGIGDPSIYPTYGTYCWHDHVAVAFKIQLVNPDLRTGYILVDLNIGLSTPILMMEDIDYPHLVYIKPEFGDKQNKTHAFQWVGQSRKYVQTRMYEFHEDGKTKLITTISYEVDRPMCAFLELPKRNLAMPDHGMLSFERNGFRRAQLKFRVLPPSVMQTADHAFSIVTYDKHDGVSGTERSTIKFRALIDGMSEDQNRIFSRVAQDLGLTRDLLWGKMVAVKLLIFDDEALVEEFYKVNEHNLFSQDDLNGQDLDKERMSLRKKLVKKTHIVDLPRYFLEANQTAGTD